MFCSVAAATAMQAPPPKVVTTATGVFTSAQASRGEQTYMSICVSCHPKGTYTAPAFRQKWNGSPLSELYGFVSSSMPKMEPGSLEPDEYAAFNGGAIVYHDDEGDYSTNEHIMDGTANLLFVLAALDDRAGSAKR